MREEFEKLAAAGKIEGRHVEPLTSLATGGFCMHRSWGFGRIKTVDTVFARFTIDFPGKPGHTMDLAFAAESLKPIPKEHILARKANDLDGVRQMAAHHLDLIKLVLNSYGGRATAEQIQQVLVPDVITRRLEEMVGNRAARNEKGRPFHRAAEKNGAGHFPGAGNVVAGTAARGFSQGKGFEGARRGGGGSAQGDAGFDGQNRPRPMKSSPR